jgi:hypothetical protein
MINDVHAGLGVEVSLRCYGKQNVSVSYGCITTIPNLSDLKQQPFNLFMTKVLWLSNWLGLS